jgi:hypothetical protein
MEITIRVICNDLPGNASIKPQAGQRIYLGIQKGDAVIDAVPASQKQAVFEPVFRVAQLPGGKTNFLGPFAKGTPQERFFYLSWVSKSADGSLKMFGRAKVHLSHLKWSLVEQAMRSGKGLAVELSMTDKKGGPVCGSQVSYAARWHA